jgi:hypothetical protein
VAGRTWDFGADAVEDRIAMGETMEFRTQAALGRTFPVDVTTFDPPVRLRSGGGMPFGLSRGAQIYGSSGNAGGATASPGRDDYTLPLLGLIWRSSVPNLGPSFEGFAQGLRQRVESGG